MSWSIQSRLTFTLTIVAIALSACMGAVLYHFIGDEMVRNFDRTLKGKGEAIVSLVSLEPADAPGEPSSSTGIPTTRMAVPSGVLDFEFNSNTMPEYRPGPRAEYFQIRFADGREYSKSVSLGNSNLPAVETTRANESVHDLALPNGRKGRAIQIGFIPQSDQPSPLPAAPMVAVIARNRGELDEGLEHLFQTLAAAAVLLGATTALTSVWIVRRLLHPLRRVAEQAAAIDAATLSARFGERELPAELAPICQRLNDLLGRLEGAFSRERRFTSDVAHELRTPIAELRSITEVALKWPDDTHATHEALSDSLAIAIQMQTLVNTLLSLVRASQGTLALKPTPIRLADFVHEVLSRLRAAHEVEDVECSVSDSAVVSAEPTLLGSTLTNLLVNASEYSHGAQPVRCFSHEESGRTRLTIENQTQGLSEADLPHMFEPFWRKEASRTNRSHAGLGLSLVKAYCGLMDVEVSAAVSEQRILQISLIFKAGTFPAQTQTSQTQARDIALSAS